MPYFQNFSKSYLSIMRQHPRYLQTSSGCKKFNSEKFSNILMFLMLFCIQNDQIQKSRKIAKNAFFSKNRLFPNGQQTIMDGQKLAQMTPKVFKTHFQSIFGVYIHSRPFFEKSKKNRFLKIFFGSCINKIGRISFFRPKIGQILLGIEKTYQCPFQKKFLRLNLGFSGFYHKKDLHRPIRPKPNF